MYRTDRQADTQKHAQEFIFKYREYTVPPYSFWLTNNRDNQHSAVMAHVSFQNEKNIKEKQIIQSPWKQLGRPFDKFSSLDLMLILPSKSTMFTA